MLNGFVAACMLRSAHLSDAPADHSCHLYECALSSQMLGSEMPSNEGLAGSKTACKQMAHLSPALSKG